VVALAYARGSERTGLGGKGSGAPAESSCEGMVVALAYARGSEQTGLAGKGSGARAESSCEGMVVALAYARGSERGVQIVGGLASEFR
jgi:hypothetical protein